MEYKEFKPVIIATIVMIGLISALCTATPGCDDLDQSILRMYDEDGDGWIDAQWTVNAAIDLDNDRINQSEYDQVKYAYEHNCSVAPIVTPTPSPTPTATPSPDLDYQSLYLVLRPEISYTSPGDLRGLRIAKGCYSSRMVYCDKLEEFLECNGVDLGNVDIVTYQTISTGTLMCGSIDLDESYHIDGCFVTYDDAETIERRGCGRIIISSDNMICTPKVEATVVPTEAKFRVGPTVALRPVNDVIDKYQDGLVELYMRNPTLNDVTLTVDMEISVPSGIHVYGEGFGYGAAAGTVAGTFTVPPGSVRTVYLNIKGEKVGTFTIHFAGLYYPDDRKDDYNPISLTHPIVVNEPSVDPLDPEPVTDKESDGIPILYIIAGLGALVVMLVIVIAARK